MSPLALDLSAFPTLPLTSGELLHRLACQRDLAGPRLARFMGYYRNPMSELADYLPVGRGVTLASHPYRQYQEIGLPVRITGFRHTAEGLPVPLVPLERQRKEVVIENDIAWRINTLIDFAVPRLPAIVSTASTPELRRTITALLNAVLEASGGAALLQHLALLGAIHGAAYLMVQPSHALLEVMARQARATARLPADGADAALEAESGKEPNVGGGPGGGGGRGSAKGSADTLAGSHGTGRSDIASPEAPGDSSDGLAWARALRLMTVDAARVLPLTAPCSPPSSVRLSHAAVLHPGASEAVADAGRRSMLQRVTRWLTGRSVSVPEPELSFDLWSDARWQRYVNGRLADEGANPLGFVPLIPLINQIAPLPAGQEEALAGEGLSEVEPLIGLQDELNTRLSDRANRVTLQSFRMYLARGVEDFSARPVGPGQMWATDNPKASIETFGGDASCPSEEAHINEVREALDKISGVPPVAAGLLRARLGNLTSAVALRITLIALLARTEKRRAALTRTLELLAQRVLEVFDAAGVLPTRPADRGIDVNWPSALPENDLEKLQEAKLKLALGVPQRVVLSELGYGEVEMPEEAEATAPAEGVAAGV